MANAFGVVPKYLTDRKHVQEWATFLRHGGGFQVW